VENVYSLARPSRDLALCTAAIAGTNKIGERVLLNKELIDFAKIYPIEFANFFIYMDVVTGGRTCLVKFNNYTYCN
jgi:hypothetical protein